MSSLEVDPRVAVTRARSERTTAGVDHHRGFDPLRDEGTPTPSGYARPRIDVVSHEYRGQIHAFVSLTKAIPQGMDCTWEISDYLKERLRA